MFKAEHHFHLATDLTQRSSRKSLYLNAMAYWCCQKKNRGNRASLMLRGREKASSETLIWAWVDWGTERWEDRLGVEAAVVDVPTSLVSHRNAWLRWLKYSAEESSKRNASTGSTFSLISLWVRLDPRSCWLHCGVQWGQSAHKGTHLRISLPSLPRDALYLLDMITLNGCGAKVRPNLPVRTGFSESFGRANLKLCIRLTNIRNNSIFASCSPIHTRFPIPKGIKVSFLTSCPWSSRNRPGQKSSGFSQMAGSLCTDHRLGIITVPLGMVYPWSTVFSEVMWGMASGTTTVSLCTSMMVASV